MRRAIALGSHSSLFSIDTRLQCRVIAYGVPYAGRAKCQPAYSSSCPDGQPQSNGDSETDRNAETAGYERPRRVARHRSLGR